MQKKKPKKKPKPKNPDDISRNLIIRCLIAQPGSVFHIILKLLISSHVMAKELTPCLVTAVATTVVIWQMMQKRTKCCCELTPSFYTLCLQFIKKNEEKKCRLFSEQPHCDSKWICLSKDVKTISKWQAVKTTEGDGEEAQDSCKKCNSNFG